MKNQQGGQYREPQIIVVGKKKATIEEVSMLEINEQAKLAYAKRMYKPILIVGIRRLRHFKRRS